jgi:hypothetical protein
MPDGREKTHHELLSFLENLLTGNYELLIKYIEQRIFSLTVFEHRFQECIALLQYFLVLDQVLQISRIGLAEKGIHKASTFLAGACYEHRIVGRDDYTGVTSDMISELLISLIIYPKLLFARFTQNADGFFRLTLQGELSFNAKARASSLHISLVAAGKIAPGETQVMNSIQQIGFTRAIGSANAGYAAIEAEAPVSIVLKLKKGDFQ